MDFARPAPLGIGDRRLRASARRHRAGSGPAPAMTMEVTRRWLIDRIRGVLHLQDPPWRIALALATGVFISFTPLYGLQSVLAVLVAAIFGLNKAATLAGA